MFMWRPSDAWNNLSMSVQTDDWKQRRIEYDHRGNSYHVACEDAELPSTNVVLSVAALEGVRPTHLPPLAETVDPDALDSVFSRSTDAAGTVSFRYAGYDVTAHAEGRLEIVPGRDGPRRQRRN